MRKKIGQLGREALAIAKQGSLMLRSRPPEGRVAGPRVVAFVHGYGAAGAVFDPMRARLERGLGVATLEYTYRSRWGFERVAAGLADRLRAVAAEGATLDLVGHSLGGLVARWYLQELGGAEVVSRAVLLATPHEGTRSARLALGPVREVLRPGSVVIRRLASGRSRAASVSHHALVAGADMMVTPPSSAAALPGAEVRWFDGLGHNAMLFDESVHDAVGAVLEDRAAPPNDEG